MKIIAHRGYWRSKDEQNTRQSFIDALKRGYGIETDFRDLAGTLVIAHDPPLPGALPFPEFVDIWQTYAQPNAWLAANIKADGLQRLFAGHWPSAYIGHHFVFDMSVPDSLHWLRQGQPTFIRQSEFEPDSPLLPQARGIWLDAFTSDWWSVDLIGEHLASGRAVCLVSPELHGRSYEKAWQTLKPLAHHPEILLCTDFPDDAERFFNGQD